MLSSSQPRIAVLPNAVQAMSGVSSANKKITRPAFWQHESSTQKVFTEIKKRDSTHEMAGWITMLDLKTQTKLSHEELVKGLRELIQHGTIEFLMGNGQGNNRYRLIKDTSATGLENSSSSDDFGPQKSTNKTTKPKPAVPTQPNDILLAPSQPVMEPQVIEAPIKEAPAKEKPLKRKLNQPHFEFFLEKLMKLSIELNRERDEKAAKRLASKQARAAAISDQATEHSITKPAKS